MCHECLDVIEPDDPTEYLNGHEAHMGCAESWREDHHPDCTCLSSQRPDCPIHGFWWDRP